MGILRAISQPTEERLQASKDHRKDGKEPDNSANGF